MTQFFDRPEGKIAFDDTGAGPLVVCVPGMGDLRGQYRFLVPQLVAAGHRVVTMDLRGHGDTSVNWNGTSVEEIGQDILALIRHLGSGPAVLIGNSMAAGAAVWAAAEGPEWVRSLVLIGPAVHGDPGLPMRLLLGALFARPWGPAAWLRYFGTLFPTRKPDDWASYTASLKQNLSQPGRLETLRQMMTDSKAASAARLTRVSVPSLILMGTKDPDFKAPEKEAAWVAGQVKGTYVMIAGAGHYPHVEMPEISGPQIVSFLNQHQPEVSLGANPH